MSAKNKAYEQFGPYILFKKLEDDALGELFRAAPVENGHPGAFVALRRLTRGDQAAFAAAAPAAAQVAALLTGPSFAKEQRIEIIDGTVAVVHDYSSGRSLRYIVDRARGNGSPTNPIPIDQAIVIAERVALSLATTAELRVGGERLLHGGLIPQFVWISDDGEIRVAGQQLGPALVASLRDEKIAAQIGRYFAPEAQHSGAVSKATEVYSLGAILYLLVTGLEPPDPTRTSAFTHAIRAAKTMTGAPMPDDIRVILEKSLNIDPAARYATPADMRAALSALSASGRYSATSFNLAFYLSNLLKKELEAEAAELEREAKAQVAPAEPQRAAAPFAAAAAPAEKKSRVPAAIAATLVLAAAGAGAWFVLAPKTQQAPAVTAPTVASVIPRPTPQRVVTAPEPIIATPAETADDATIATVETDTAAAARAEEAARKKAFEDAVRKRLQQELLKLQAEYTRQLQQQQAQNAPRLTAAPPAAATQTTAPHSPSIAPEPEEAVLTAAELTRQRLEARRAEEAATATVAQREITSTVASIAPPAAAPVQATQTTAPAPPPAPVVREGDVVDMADLDEVPRPVREPRPVYPPIAARQKIEATIMASLLISETGEVLDVKILRGDQRFGFNESAIRAFRSARYTPAMKDGKRVKTWAAQMIQFRP